MQNKRIEIYLGWTCNSGCIFCSEKGMIDKNKDKIISERQILKQLIKYKKMGYNHVTFLGGEPFIQKNFLFSLKAGKKLGYKILITTNASILQFERLAKKYLPYIDELILSIHTINQKTFKRIHSTNIKINYENVFKNIRKYSKGLFFKINTIINPLNLDEIGNIISYLGDKKIDEISLTYPDTYKGNFTKEHKICSILVNYSKIKKYIRHYYIIAKKNNIKLKLADIPICFFPSEVSYKLSNDFDYDNRLKVDSKGNEIDRNIISPRNRAHVINCKGCNYNNICWGPGVEYIEYFGDSEIIPIIL